MIKYVRVRFILVYFIEKNSNTCLTKNTTEHSAIFLKSMPPVCTIEIVILHSYIQIYDIFSCIGIYVYNKSFININIYACIAYIYAIFIQSFKTQKYDFRQ